MQYLKRLLDPVILMSTIVNIVSILYLLNAINTDQIEIIKSVSSLLISCLVQLGIMKQPNITK